MFFSLIFFELFGFWFAVYCVDAVLLVKQKAGDGWATGVATNELIE